MWFDLSVKGQVEHHAAHYYSLHLFFLLDFCIFFMFSYISCKLEKLRCRVTHIDAILSRSGHSLCFCKDSCCVLSSNTVTSSCTISPRTVLPIYSRFVTILGLETLNKFTESIKMSCITVQCKQAFTGGWWRLDANVQWWWSRVLTQVLKRFSSLHLKYSSALNFNE